MTYEAFRIGEKLAHYRKKRGISQEALANQLKITRQAISKWECDEAMPDLQNLKYLAQALNFSVDELLNIKKGADGGLAAELKWNGGDVKDHTSGDQSDQSNQSDISEFGSLSLDQAIYRAIEKNDKDQVSDWWAEILSGASALLITPIFLVLIFKGHFLSFMLYFIVPVAYYVGKLLPLAVKLYHKRISANATRGTRF